MTLSVADALHFRVVRRGANIGRFFRGGMGDFGEELVADGAMVKKCCGVSENMLRFCW